MDVGGVPKIELKSTNTHKWEQEIGLGMGPATLFVAVCVHWHHWDWRRPGCFNHFPSNK